MILEDLQYVSYLGEQRKQLFFARAQIQWLVKDEDIGTYLIFFHRKVENALIKSY